MKIAVFYHVARLNNWKAVDDEIMMALNDFLLPVDYFERNETDGTDYEFPTLEKMREFSRNNPKYYVLYLHTKGVSKPELESVAHWRKCMLFFLVENWHLFVKQLHKYDAASINFMNGPMPHFQGNFWWATAKYINTLGDIHALPDLPVNNNKFSERHKCEMWLLSNPMSSYISLYHHRIDPYIKLNPKINYEHIISYLKAKYE